jgi:hypothetical protein
VSDIDTEAADSLKALDPKRPIREADMVGNADRSTRSRMTQSRHPADLQRTEFVERGDYRGLTGSIPLVRIVASASSDPRKWINR